MSYWRVFVHNNFKPLFGTWGRDPPLPLKARRGCTKWSAFRLFCEVAPLSPQGRNSIPPIFPTLYIGRKHVLVHHTNVLGARGNSSGSLTSDGDQKVAKGRFSDSNADFGAIWMDLVDLKGFWLIFDHFRCCNRSQSLLYARKHFEWSPKSFCWLVWSVRGPGAPQKARFWSISAIFPSFEGLVNPKSLTKQSTTVTGFVEFSCTSC